MMSAFSDVGGSSRLGCKITNTRSRSHLAESSPSAVPSDGAIKVAIVEDEEPMRGILRAIIESAGEYCCIGSHANASEALREIPRNRPGVVLMDINMPGLSGIECTRRLKTAMPRLKVVMLTGLTDERSIEASRRAGADQYITKPFAVAQLLATLKFVVARDAAHVPTTHLQNLSIIGDPPPAIALTQRENEFMKHLAEGIPYKQIADRMGVGFWRVHNLQRQAFKKFRVQNGIEAVRRWLQTY